MASDTNPANLRCPHCGSTEIAPVSMLPWIPDWFCWDCEGTMKDDEILDPRP